MAYEGKLVIKWSKRDEDLIYHYPRKCDGSYACAELDGPLAKFLDEMEHRGYDRGSFRLSIRRGT